MLNVKTAFCGFSVDDLAQAKKFYTKTLGLSIKNEDMGLELNLAGGGSVFIYEKTDHKPATYTVLNLAVADIDAAVDELAKSGVVFEHYNHLPGDQDEKQILRGLAAGQGPDIAWFKDPAGNILSILQNS